MRLYLCFVCLVFGVWGKEEEKRELIMLEIETLPEGGSKELVKRSPQEGSTYSGQQYVLGQSESVPQVPGEYLSLLQQLQSQQGVTSQQVPANDIHQLLVSRGPYQFTATQSQRPPRPRLTPEQQQQRRLQETVAQKAIREQETRDAQRHQLREYYQQLGIPAGSYQLQPQAQQLQAQLPTHQPIQYYQPVLPQQAAQPSYYQSEPDQISYAQVQFGGPSQSLASKSPGVIYQRQPSQQVVYRVPSTESPKSAVGAPQQYLIETTKPEDQQQVVAIPRPVVYYSPQGDYGRVGAGQEDYTRGEITSRPSVYAPRSEAKGVRVAGPQGQRPLTQSELKALIDAGFQVGSQQQLAPAGYLSPYSQRAYYRGIGKRQSKRVPKPVPLSKEQREAFAQQGIRNLYAIESVAESNEKPVTYVLALGKPYGS